MPTLSKLSRAHLASCDDRIIKVIERSITRIHFSVRCGHRGQAEQDAVVHAGKSKTPWPESKHNRYPSHAVDIYPYPFKNEYWHQPQVWADLARVIFECAGELGVQIRWGGVRVLNKAGVKVEAVTDPRLPPIYWKSKNDPETM